MLTHFPRMNYHLRFNGYTLSQLAPLLRCHKVINRYYLAIKKENSFLFLKEYTDQLLGKPKIIIPAINTPIVNITIKKNEPSTNKRDFNIAW